MGILRCSTTPSSTGTAGSLHHDHVIAGQGRPKNRNPGVHHEPEKHTSRREVCRPLVDHNVRGLITTISDQAPDAHFLPRGQDLSLRPLGYEPSLWTFRSATTKRRLL